MILKKRFIKVLVLIGIAAMLMMPFATCTNKNIKVIDAGSTWEVAKTSKLDGLTVRESASIKAPDGYSLTMTVDGIQQDILPGRYSGDIVLTVSENNVVNVQQGNLSYYFRQALYVDKTGVVENKSVTAAVKGGEVTDTGVKNIMITSEGENFNGIYVSGGTYTVEGAKIDFTGNGSNDFAGYGAAVVCTGNDTTLVLDKVDIKTHGVVRTAILANGGNLIVKNSKIETHDGILPADYLPTTSMGHMWVGPWTLGISGNSRATNLTGDGPTATYINSEISAEGWGVLSTDAPRNGRLNAINSKISIIGDSGYGTFVDQAGTTNSLYGCEFDVSDYGAIISGTINFGASTADKVSELNASLSLGLTDNELKAIEEKQTVVNSGRFGVMFSKDRGIVNIKDGTVFNCKEAIFLVKGYAAEINVDGSGGVRLESGKGIITQVMDRDRAVPRDDPASGMRIYDTYYTEPYANYDDIVKDKTHDVTVADSSDITGNYSNIELNGNFYNGRTGIEGREDYPSSNLVLNFNNTKITGVISATFAKHAKSTFGPPDYKLVGEVSNTPCPAINNGVIVSLDATSKWTITGTSYLTKLVIEDGATVTASAGKTVTMTVNGVAKPIKAGTFTGAIELIVS